VRVGSILTTLLIVVTTTLLSIFDASNATLVAASPYPATLVMQRGLTESSAVRPLPWGTELPSSQTKWVTVRSSGPAVEWESGRRMAVRRSFPSGAVTAGFTGKRRVLFWPLTGRAVASSW
jgi:hypothetical protein